MKRVKSIISGIVWTVVGLYFMLIILLHIPVVQGWIGAGVSSALSNKLGTKVKIGRIDLGFMNRLIIDDVTILDQKGVKMLRAARLAAKVDYLPLIRGKVSISSVQVFGMTAVLYKQTERAKPNYQFVIDSLTSKDTTRHAPFELHVASLLIRHGAVSYQNHYVPRSKTFSINSLNVKDISTHIIINTLTQDSVNVNVKRISLNEASGLQLKSLSLLFKANKRAAQLSNLNLELPQTSLNISKLNATYTYNKNKINKHTIAFNANLIKSYITPEDLNFLIPQLGSAVNPIYISSHLQGTSNRISINNLRVSSSKENFNLLASGYIENLKSTPKWYAHINNLNFNAVSTSNIVRNFGLKLNIPAFVKQFDKVSYRGTISGTGSNIFAEGTLLSAAGNANLTLNLLKHRFAGSLRTRKLDLKKITGNSNLGYIATNINISGTLPIVKGHSNLYAKGVIESLDYNRYTYHNLMIDGRLNNGTFDGTFGMNDPNGEISVQGNINLTGKTPAGKLQASVKHFNPHALKIAKGFTETSFNFTASTDFTGKDFNTANGTFDITDFNIKSPTKNYSLSELHLEAKNNNGEHTITMLSDFGSAEITGKFNYSTIVSSFTNLIASKLPTIPDLYKKNGLRHNNFNIIAKINNSEWLERVFNIPLQLNKKLTLTGSMNDNNEQLNMIANVPDFLYAGNKYNNARVNITTQGDTLKADIHVNKVSDNGHVIEVNVNAAANNNKLSTNIAFNDPNMNNLAGELKTDTRFFKTTDNLSAVNVNVRPSVIQVGDSIWQVQPSSIIYGKNHLDVRNFAVRHNNQHIIINGLASKSNADSLFVDLKDINVGYTLELINFHAVRFDGSATGRAFISNVFNKEPQVAANLTVNQFKFQDSGMGVLTAKVELNNEEQRLDINATANDGPLSQTLINGYISPQHKNIDLNFNARNTRLGFVGSFCSSFLKDFNVFGYGGLRLNGQLNALNLTGQVVATGSMGVTALNTMYTMRGDTINLVPNEIQFPNDTIYDKDMNMGIISGSVYHENLKNVSYNIGIKARNLLSYDFQDFSEQPFSGTVYATGNCDIRGKSGEVTIDVNATPQKNSTLVYDVSSPEGIKNNEFIHWNSNKTDSIAAQTDNNNIANSINDRSTDIHLNLLINSTPDATLKLIMDNRSGDYIDLNGNGVIRAAYYNKGDFNMYGNYVIDHGIYKLTIQNVIKKDFMFTSGGTIAFEGDPYSAVLNLKAQYTVNGVSLSDLNLGSNFATNNIRVNCLMNITGTPNAPKIDFSLDMPTVNNDAKQMIYNLINGEEDMNRQVLYLLAIGRFYNEGNNNSSSESASRQSQTSMAMQSILSGTLSQQINNVLSTVVNNNNWNLGANISTGDEGWNNAEYEGLLSGRLLNNRLLINGQFGYRDNANATTSFIGDFDIRYLLFPNGNLAIRVYNQANDRYFTKNSLNTQGIGFIIKRDFNGWRDLLGIKSRAKKE